MRIESPRNNPDSSVSGVGMTSERLKPKTSAGTATRKPPHGPAAPMSKRARRSRGTSRMRMKAPKVPMKKNGGAGMK
jgi:hypothetical protein